MKRDIDRAAVARRAQISRFLSVAIAAIVVATGGVVPAAFAAETYSISGTVRLGAAALVPAVGEVTVKYRSAAHWYSEQQSVDVDAIGNYTIPNLPNGSYEIYFKYNGSGAYSSTYYNQLAENSFTGVYYPVSVSGVDVTGVDDTLEDQGSISGVVSLGESGVTAGQGEVKVWYARNTGNSWTGLINSGAVLTDASGAFVLTNLVYDQYRIFYEYLGSGSFQSQYFGGGFTASTAASTTVDASTSTLVRNITLPPKGTLSGVVTLGGTPAPAGAVTVSLEYFNPVSAAYNQFPSATTSTLADGSYSIPGLNGYTYRATYTYAGTDFAPSLVGLPFTPGSVVRDVSLEPRHSAGGIVYLGDTSRVATAGEVRVDLLTPTGATVVATTTTSAAGAYLFTGRVPGSYKLRFTHLGSTGNFPVWVRPSDLILSTSLLSESVTMPTANTISGLITDSEGAPVPGFTVGVTRWQPGTYNYLGAHVATTQTDGSYSLTGLPHGEYILSYSAPGFPTAYHFEAPNQYAAERITLEGGETLIVDGVLYEPSTISGVVTGVTPAELSNGNVVGELYYFNYLVEAWEQQQTFVVQPDGTYSLPGLFPYTYAVSLYYSGARGVAAQYSDVLDLYEGEDGVFDAYLSPYVPMQPATLVKRAGNPAVYLVDGFDELIPVPSIPVATDAGISPTVQTISEVQFGAYEVRSTPLSNVVNCNGYPYLATGGKIIPGNEYYLELFENLPTTELDVYTCAYLPRGSYDIAGNLFLGSPASGKVYQISPDGVKHVAAGAVYPTAPQAIRVPGDVYPVNSYFLNSLPTGGTYLTPGSLVRNPAGSVFLVDGATSLVPVTSLTTAKHLGLETNAIASVASSDLVGRTKTAQPLQYVVRCNDYNWTIGATSSSGFGPFGAITDPGPVAGIPFTQLDFDTTCAYLGSRAGYTGISALVVRTASSPTLYFVDQGTKKPLPTMGAAVAAAAPNPLVINYVSAEFIASLPLGPTSVSPGMLVKTAASSTVYLVDTATRFVPLGGGVPAEFGLSPTVTTVSPATLTGVAIAPSSLSNFVSCGATYYVAAQGKLWPTTSGVVGSMAVTALSTGLCAALPKSSTALNTPAFLKSASTGTIFAVDAGVRRKILSTGSMARLTGGDPVVTVTVNSPFLASIPLGADIVDAGMVVKVADGSLYLVTGDSSVAKLRTVDTVSEMGLPTTAVMGSIAGRTVDAALLSNLVSCGANFYLAAQGKLWPTTSGVVGSLPVTALSTGLCAALPKSTTALNSPAFVRSASTGTVFALDAGVRRKILSTGSMARLTGGAPVVTVSVNSPFLASIPSGADIIDPGMLIKSAEGPSIFLITGPTSITKIRTFDTVAEMGLSTAYVTVSAATVAAMTRDSQLLSNLVDCGESTYIASGGTLWLASADVVGGAPATVLSAGLCDSLPKSATSLSSSVFLKSPTAPTVFSLYGGEKRAMRSWAELTAWAGGNPIIILPINAPYVATLPVGAPTA